MIEAAQSLVDKDPSRRRMVYSISSPTGKVYIGVTNNLSRRIKEHSRNKSAIGASLRKHGIAFHSVRAIAILSAEDAYILEQKAVAAYNTISPNGLNLAVGGEGILRHTPESKRKMSEAKAGKKPENGTVERFTEWVKRPKSEEHRASISSALKGRALSKAHKSSLSRAAKYAARNHEGRFFLGRVKEN